MFCPSEPAQDNWLHLLFITRRTTALLGQIDEGGLEGEGARMARHNSNAGRSVAGRKGFSST